MSAEPSSQQLAWFAQAHKFGARRALLAGPVERSYAELLERSVRVALELLDGAADLEERRVAFLVPAGAACVETQWGIWRAGGIAVPLCTSHPAPELEYVLRDCGADTVVVSQEHATVLAPVARRLGLRILASEGLPEPGSRSGRASLPRLGPERRALIVYTSGSTGGPKGVVASHDNLRAQVQCLVEAWGWTAADRILNVLPLHHVHGIVNVVACALWSGALCEMHPGFDAEAVWERLGSGELTLFMAVPTIYARLLDAYERADAGRRQRWSQGARCLRLMVSGSAALPVRLLEAWQSITGHRLLERYGMTETGMILSNPLRGERVAGSVGSPLPGVEVRLRDGGEAAEEGGRRGELEVRGPGVFGEYWGRPGETREAFSADGWFRTGDVALLEGERYRLLGRSSVDILKTGGYKVSALEIEEVLREHPAIAECAVVGLEDDTWGQRVGAAVVLGGGQSLELEELRVWGKERLAPYKVPTRLLVVPALPRNALGKVVKPRVVELFGTQSASEESGRDSGAAGGVGASP